MDYNKELERLRAQTDRKLHLQSILENLLPQKKALAAQVQDLDKKRQKEQADVERLEGRSLSAFFYGVIGRMDEKLSKEREEAYAAAVKYDAAMRELESVEYDIRHAKEELDSLQGCDAAYSRLLEEKAVCMKETVPARASEILKLEDQISRLEREKKEITEAVSAGKMAQSTVNQILSSLSSAESWGRWDLVGGGMFSAMAKHGHLDEAQEKVEKLQVELRRFRTELLDVEIQSDMQIHIDGFLRFADFFFDGLFADWAVLDRINQSQTRAEETKRQIEALLCRLGAMLDKTEQEQEKLKESLNEMIFKA